MGCGASLPKGSAARKKSAAKAVADQIDATTTDMIVVKIAVDAGTDMTDFNTAVDAGTDMTDFNKVVDAGTDMTDFNKAVDAATDMTDFNITFGYWAIRGGPRGNATRYMLNYANVRYIEKSYTFEKKEIWKQDKTAGEAGDFQWMNLPYIIDGENKISQCIAVQ